MSRGGIGITSKKKSHIPVRTCIVCRKKKAKGELIRLSVDQDNTLIADMNGTRKGRGAYLCRNQFCREKLTLIKKMDRIFKTDVRAISSTIRSTN